MANELQYQTMDPKVEAELAQKAKVVGVIAAVWGALNIFSAVVVYLVTGADAPLPVLLAMGIYGLAACLGGSLMLARSLRTVSIICAFIISLELPIGTVLGISLFLILRHPATKRLYVHPT